MRLDHILVPTDFSDCAHQAWLTAIEMARQEGARLTLLHVFHLSTALPAEAMLPVPHERHHESQHAVEQALEELCRRARAQGVDAAWKTEWGSTAREICDVVTALSVDLVIMGRHGAGGFSIGSVTERVVRKATCAVLTVRAQSESWLQL